MTPAIKTRTMKGNYMDMDFLKEILGEDLYKQFSDKLNAYNGDDANKEKQIKLANLTSGDYVSKNKYTSLEADLSGKSSELEKANSLIEELKKASKADEGLQQKITDYETTISELQSENEKLKVDNALKFALSEAGAVDVDYLVYKAKEKSEIKLDENGKIKGEEELIADLKTQLSTMFNKPKGKEILDNPLPEGNGDKTVTKEQFNMMGYNERLKLKKDNPEMYRNLSKG